VQELRAAEVRAAHDVDFAPGEKRARWLGQHGRDRIEQVADRLGWTSDGVARSGSEGASRGVHVGSHKYDVSAASALGATQAQRVHHHDERHVLDCGSGIVNRSHEVTTASGDNRRRSFDDEHLVVGEGELVDAINRELGTGGSFVAHCWVVVGDVGARGGLAKPTGQS
jgi:hypothetical protein